jgi:hypothetical protein
MAEKIVARSLVDWLGDLWQDAAKRAGPSLLAQAVEHGRKADLLHALIWEKPPEKSTRITVGIEDAIDALTKGSGSKVVRARARRKVVRGIESGQIRLSESDVMGLKPLPAGRLNRALARRLAIEEWMRTQNKDIAHVATGIISDSRLRRYTVRTIEKWIADLHPRRLK